MYYCYGIITFPSLYNSIHLAFCVVSPPTYEPWRVANFKRYERMFARPLVFKFMCLVYIVTCVLHTRLCFCLLYCKVLLPCNIRRLLMKTWWNRRPRERTKRGRSNWRTKEIHNMGNGKGIFFIWGGAVSFWGIGPKRRTVHEGCKMPSSVPACLW